MVGSRRGRRASTRRKRSAPMISQVTRTQAISTFGPGAIFELRQSSRAGNSVNSVMMSGIDQWSIDRSKNITEPALALSLGVNGFYAPPPVPDNIDFWNVPDNFISATRFPRWLVCSKCNRLGEVGVHFDDSGPQPKCQGARCRGRGIPVRLVSACFPTDRDSGQPGHIDEFPWAYWAHSQNPGQVCDAPQLKLINTGDSVGLAGLKVICVSNTCKGHNVGRTLQSVFGEHALSGMSSGCTGSRPWLGDNEPNCQRPVRALMRGASNVYFPVTASALSIPPNSGKLVQLVGQADETILNMWLEGKKDEAIRYFRKATPAAKRYTDKQISRAFIAVHDTEDRTPLTEEEQRAGERAAIIEGIADEDGDGSDFECVPVDPTIVAAKFDGHLSHLVRLNRLREVRAIRGFTRINRQVGGDAYDRVCAPIYVNDPRWLPAVEVRGEGVYFELDKNRLEAWQTRSEVQERLEVMHGNLKRAAAAESKELNNDQLPTASFVALHTLTHLVINQLSLICGYSTASLRERLYVAKNGIACGALIYTSAPGADGTLGGLVRQGKPDNFSLILWNAIREGFWCSSDPLCIESTGQGPSGVNLAACHACSLISETSCEYANMKLDRAFLVGLPEKRQLGLFSDLVGREL